MKLNLSDIKGIALGTVRVEQEEKGISFYRFTEEQESLYKARSDDFYKKTFAASGIRLCFKTDSKSLRLGVFICEGSSRKYFAFELFVDGKRIDTLDNYGNLNGENCCANASPQLGDYLKEFSLPEGIKEITLYFPWSMRVYINEFSLDDGAFFEAVKPKKTLLCFGDSITQGYDAVYPSNRYTAKLANILCAEEYSKAIGGEIFFPALSLTKEAFEPDYITVAYGTNDWNRCEREVLENNCREFFKNLSNTYPNSKIFAITPIWRKDRDMERKCGIFDVVAEIICQAVEDIPNITPIIGYDFVPKDEKLFGDLRLHPNDAGFEYYFNSLNEEIKNNL